MRAHAPDKKSGPERAMRASDANFASFPNTNRAADEGLMKWATIFPVDVVTLFPPCLLRFSPVVYFGYVGYSGRYRHRVGMVIVAVSWDWILRLAAAATTISNVR